MMPTSLVRGPLRTIVRLPLSSPASTRAFSTHIVLKTSEASSTDSSTQQESTRPPRRPFGAKKRFDNNSNNERRARRFSGNKDRTTAKFERPASVPYNTQQPLYFAEPEDWVVSSVTAPRPLYANVATGDADATSDKIGAALIETATVTGFRAHGVLDPWVEQSVVRELSEIEKAGSAKDHRKKADTSVEYQDFYIQGLSSTVQEILNPKNKINRFNNGGLANAGLAQIKYEASSEETAEAGKKDGSATTSAVAKDETLVERSWKRLEYYGGDYTRPAHPLNHLASQPPQGIKPAGPKGKVVLEHVNGLIGQNQTIGFEDKKKMLRAVQKGLSGY
ncbi:hypothetical protein BGZ73_006680 [Actinomortierella ambigua]|nr:hypothetical protein BGZ73_006680 [Actinomortierella ambigua]